MVYIRNQELLAERNIACPAPCFAVLWARCVLAIEWCREDFAPCHTLRLQSSLAMLKKRGNVVLAVQCIHKNKENNDTPLGKAVTQSTRECIVFWGKKGILHRLSSCFVLIGSRSWRHRILAHQETEKIIHRRHRN